MVSDCKKTTSQIVREYILSGIIQRKFLPGTPMREEIVCEACSCSATPVREAFRQLEKEGWRTNFPYRGCFVRILDADEVSEIFYIREAIESRAVLSLVRNKERDLTPLRKVVSAMEQALSRESLNESGSYIGDIDFHRTLLDISGLAKLSSYAHSLDSQLRSFTVPGLRNFSHENLSDFWAQHHLILWAIEHRWERSAEGLIRDHIEQSRLRTLEQMKALEYDDSTDTRSKGKTGRKKSVPKK